MSRKDLISSPLARLLRLGGLAGRVGLSMAAQEIGGLLAPKKRHETRRHQSLLKNAARIAETLGQLKGAAMKVGQMLSLHETILPPEVVEVLQALQKHAPPVPFESVEKELEARLPDRGRIFAEVEPEAFAAASIGQVHRGRLRDGREVAIKIQYPGIDRVIEADLANLKRVLKSVIALVADIKFDPIWLELRDRLREELDYEREAATIERMAELHAEVPGIVIPRVVPKGTARTVLTTELVEGLPGNEACDESIDQRVRNRWGLTLFEFLLRGLFTNRLLHADPNLANFAFLPDGRVVVYDFGCVKEIPPRLLSGYKKLCSAALFGRGEEIPGILAGMGVHRADGSPLPGEMVFPYLELIMEVLEPGDSYRFGEDSRVYRRLIDLAWSNIGNASDIRFPRDIIFINRTVVGHFGNLSRLRASGPWRDRVLRFSGARE